MTRRDRLIADARPAKVDIALPGRYAAPTSFRKARMRKPLAVAATVLCLIASICLAQETRPSTRPTFDSVVTQMLAKMTELNDVLRSVTDETTSKAAAPKIKAIQVDLVAIAKQANALGRPTSRKMDELDTKYGTKMQEAQMVLRKETDRVGADPKLIDAKNAIDELHRAMSGL